MSSHFVPPKHRLFGHRRWDWSRGLFGGSACLSFGIIFLITLFLASEAVRFFPAHRAELQRARKSGQEYVDHLIWEARWAQEVVSLTNQAYFQELDARFVTERGLVEGFLILESLVEEEAEGELDDWAEARAEGAAEREAEAACRRKVAEVLAATSRDEVDSFGRLAARERAWQDLQEAVLNHDFLSGELPPLIKRAEERMAEGTSSLAGAREIITAATRPLQRLRDRLVAIASQIREEAAGREDFPFDEKITPILAARDEHVKTVADLREGLTRGIGALPDEGLSPPAARLVEEIREKQEPLEKKLRASVAAAQEWDGQADVGWAFTVIRFFFGTEWRSGSEWRQVYGLLPLLTGSLMVSVIAMTLAVPLAIGAAVYVNQLSARREQTLIKPAIEMIQAIPTVVLGFFGIMVLGDLLVEGSASPLVSWLPGFPIEERLNVFNAGLLLALMAVPTIFTLCEDALNHVPRSFTEASLALGASKLQTVGAVVVPAAVSGIFAAVLLGFGRVIGETMVVLLVAGNRVAMPDWSAGLGVVTQPSHTMTGMIAQEMGHVGMGSLHYRALFLLGLILFLISLAVNLAAGRLAKRFLKYG